jgi:hypothetical protein
MATLYSDLPLIAAQSIRILTILPNKATEQIQCTLQVVHLPEAPEYEALSYVWGTQDPPTRIICNGIPTAVGPNLAAAMQQIRLVDKPRLVWIDALCIAQTDLKERSAQVAFMQVIYQRASRVLMWLGVDDDGSVEVALGLIDKAVQLARHETGSRKIGPNDIGVELPSLERNLSRGFPPPQDPSWKALVRLYENPYFARVWVWQEVYNAASVITVIGDHRQEWDHFGLATQWFVCKGYAKLILGLGCSTCVVYLYALAKLKARGGHPGRLEETLSGVARRTRATDPRDKVYALLGLSNAGDILLQDRRTTLYPDYEKAVVDVYIDTIRYFLQNPSPGQIQSLIFLSISSLSNTVDGSSQHRFPSWVPPWDTNFVDWRFSSSTEAISYRAAKDKEVCFGFNDLRYSLFLKGFHVDYIKTVDNYFYGLGTSANRPDLWRAVKTLWILTVRQLEKTNRCHNREGLSLAFALALAVYAPINALKVQHIFNASDFVAYCNSHLEAETKDMSEEERTQHLASFPMPVHNESIEGKGILFEESICVTKPFFLTNTGFIGRCHALARAGDQLCIFYGATTPHILKPRPDHHKLIGDCYVPGLMYGEALEMSPVECWFELR